MQETDRTPKKLYRSRTDRYLGGVCGGLAEYFEIDNNVTRILFAISAFMGGLGIILYVAALVLVPENPVGMETTSGGGSFSRDNTMFWGILFVALGGMLLFWELGFFHYFDFIDFHWTTVWGVFLVAIGAGILFFHWKKNQSLNEDETTFVTEEIKSEAGPKSTLYRSRTNRKIAGICGGMAKYFNIDPTIIRLSWIILTIASKGLGLIIYIIFIFVLQEDPSEQAAL